MGMPPTFQIKPLDDPRSPYQYVAYCGWPDMDPGYGMNGEWIEYFTETHGHDGYLFGASWHHDQVSHKIYIKEKDYPFFMMKFSHQFHKRPWEI